MDSITQWLGTGHYNALRYSWPVIRSFKDKEMERVWQGKRSRRLPHAIQASARRKLRMLNNAQSTVDLRILPANRLEALKGNRRGQQSIRINEIVLGKRAITADTTLRLARFFGTSEKFWVGRQADYDLKEAAPTAKGLGDIQRVA